MLIVSQRVGNLIRVIEAEHPDWVEIEVLLEAYRRDSPELQKEIDFFWGKGPDPRKENNKDITCDLIGEK